MTVERRPEPFSSLSFASSVWNSIFQKGSSPSTFSIHMIAGMSVRKLEVT
jgi:hypothetical protein